MTIAKLHLRLDPDLGRRLEEFRVSSGFDSAAQAARAAMALGLDRAGDLEATWRKSTRNEAVRQVLAIVNEALSERDS